ncbi:FG-GAP-like repeat-containing protein [Leptolyngbya sp. ST-U4]|uniref:FG-GAP-like repeat-containing protein n=1 Tax=Leptolyngbya sp. ST-U4 TaxID=2933912 RepID=UPI00199E65E1|nr:VCBS repeat-containing protein [Cyanobacteria bacterium FACHB-502]
MTSPNGQTGTENPVDSLSMNSFSTPALGNKAPVLSFGSQYTQQIGSQNPVSGINVGSFSSPTFADLSGDGKLDAIVGEVSGTLRYYLNTGTATEPAFTEQTGSSNPFNGIDLNFYSRPTLADLSGDGKLDAIVGEVSGTLRYYLNTGTATEPAFTEQTGSSNPFNGINVGSFSSPSFADLDGDGKLDAVVGEINGTLRYYKNTSTDIALTFAEQTGSSNPFNGINVGGFSSPTFADLDGDGRLDAIVGGEDGTLKYYKNTSTDIALTFAEQTGSKNPISSIDVGGYSSPSLVDLNQDGKLDAIVGEANGTLKYYEFITTTTAPALAYQEQSAAALIDPNLTVTDVDSADFNGGSLTIGINSITSSDRLLISADADFTLDGFNLSYQGSLLGSISGGDGSNLVINFSSSATPEVVTALLRRVSYTSTANDPPASRTVSFVLTEADGTASEPLIKTINITGVNDAPIFTKGQDIVINADAPAQSIDWATNISAIEAGQTLTFVVTTDNDALFATKPAIDPATGKLTYTLAGAVVGVANITVTLKDNGGTANGGVDATQETFTLTVNPGNQAPSAVTLTNTTTSIAENASTSTRIKVADIGITDDGLGTNTLSLSGADASLFEIESNVLYLKANTVLDYEARNSYSVTVNADDSALGATPDASQTFTLNVTNVNEAPTAVTFTDTTTSIADSTDTTTRTKVAEINASDDGLGTNTLSLSGTDASSFEIDGSTLYLKANTVLNQETKGNYSVTVNVDDPALGATPDASQVFTLTVTSANKAPGLKLTNIATTIAENTDTSTRVKVADISIIDDGKGTNTLFLTEEDADLFEIDNNALYLKAGTVVNYEQEDLYDVVVNVKDEAIGSAPSASYALTLTITDVNEAPTALNFFNPVSTIAENANTTTRLKMANITVTDDGLGGETFSLAGADANLFEIENSVLYLKAGTAIDYETKSSYSVTVEVDDPTVGGKPDVSQTFNLRVSDVKEASDPVQQPSVSPSSPGSPGSPTSQSPTPQSPTSQPPQPFTFIASLPFNLKRNNPIAGVVYRITKEGTPDRDSYEGDSENDALWGLDNADRLLGKDGHDFLSGGNDKDYIEGGAGNDLIFGGLGNDFLVGGDGDDIMLGRMGKDRITGGSGKDMFVFAKPAERPDRITDFEKGDQIVVLGRSFKGGLKAGTLNAKHFHMGPKAFGADDRFIYNRRTGVLAFDADGTGSRKAIVFAQLEGSPNLTSQSILIV